MTDATHPADNGRIRTIFARRLTRHVVAESEWRHAACP